MDLKEMDMTRGNTAGNTARLFGPLLGAFFLNILYDLTDSLWIGNILGEKALAVQTTCIPVSLLFIRAEGLIPRPLGRMKGIKSRLQYL